MPMTSQPFNRATSQPVSAQGQRSRGTPTHRQEGTYFHKVDLWPVAELPKTCMKA